jgi:hypothetical protein
VKLINVNVLKIKNGFSYKFVFLLKFKKKNMKKINYILVAFAMIIAITACKPKTSSDKKDSENKITFSSATEYNDFIINAQGKIINSVLSLADAMNAGKNDVVKEKYKAFGEQTKKALDTVKLMDEYNGNSGFRDESIRLFQFYYDIYQHEYKEMIDIVVKEADKITDQDRTRITEIQESVTKKETVRDSAFAAAQDKFAKDNNMQIIKNDIQDKIDNMNKK